MLELLLIVVLLAILLDEPFGSRLEGIKVPRSKLAREALRHRNIIEIRQRALKHRRPIK